MRAHLLGLPALATAVTLTFGGMAGAAEPRGFAAAFGNTVKAAYPDGRSQRYWFKADGTWRAVGRRGTSSSGKWTQKGEKVCLKQTKPFAGPFRYCTSFPAGGALGSSWPAKDAGGGKITLSLVRGGG